MSSEDDLHTFVRRAIGAGATRDAIVQSLAEAGWSPTQIRDVLDRFTGATVAGVAVPRPKASSKARDAFVYGGMFAALFVSAWALGAISFSVVDVVLGQTELALFRLIRWPLSVAIVSAPAFLLLDRLVDQETVEDPNRKMSDVRRTLTYFTLFVSALVLLGVTAGLIYSLLGGELALSFALKSLVVGGISGYGFVHYLREMRDEPLPLEPGGPQEAGMRST